MGTPNELTDEDGNVVWLADYNAWGGVSSICKDFHYKEQSVGGVKITADELQPIRFQGQFFDSETGLHYNRFRYYDCDIGMFVSRDPIELEGGLNVFQYAPNPTGWIDPFGLVKIYRGMKDAMGVPLPGPTARTLGARPEIDIPVENHSLKKECLSLQITLVIYHHIENLPNMVVQVKIVYSKWIQMIYLKS